MSNTNIQYDPFERYINDLNTFKSKELKKIDGLTFETAARKFEQLLKAEVQKEKLSITEETKNKIGHMIYYFMNDEQCEFDLNKGIFLFGNTGTGKTSLLKSFMHFTRVTRLKEFKIISSKRIVKDVLTEGNASSLSKYSLKSDPIDFAFDDVGHENECTIYGTKINCLEDILTERYDLKLLTHATSNLNPSMFKDFYGQRLYSRLNEMFNVIQIKGKDLRCH